MKIAKLHCNRSTRTAISDHADVLRRLYTQVSVKIDAQSLARNMFQSNVITLKELQSIQSQHNESIKAAERLLNIVMNQSSNVFSSFLDALKETGHQRVYEVIVKGKYKGTIENITFIHVRV